VTTLHFESGSKSDGKDHALYPLSPKQPSPSSQARFLPPADGRGSSSSSGGGGGGGSSSSSSVSLAEALRIVGSIGAAPLSIECIVERSDAAAIALIGCMRTRLFVLTEPLDDPDTACDGSAQGGSGRMRAMQIGVPDADYLITGCAGVCLHTQQPLVYNDISAATEFVLNIEGCGQRAPISQAFAPITIAGSLHSKPIPLGVLQVCTPVLSSRPFVTAAAPVAHPPQVMNKSAIPSVFTASDASQLQVIAQAVANALNQLHQLQKSTRAIASLTSFARSIPLLTSCSAASAVAEYVERRLPLIIHARSARLLLMNNHNTDVTTWRLAASDDACEEPAQQLRLPCKSMWNIALRAGGVTVVNDTRADPRFGRQCSFGSVMLVPIYGSDAVSERDEFGTQVVVQGSGGDKATALGIIEIKDKQSQSGFSQMDEAVAENISKTIAAVLQRGDVRMQMHESDLEGRLQLEGTFLQQVRQAEALIARQSGMQRCFIFLSHNDLLSYRHPDGRTSTVDPNAYPFNVCCSRLSVVVYPSARNASSSVDWHAAFSRISTSLCLDSLPHSFMVLPLLGGCHAGVDSMPFGVAVCLQWAGSQSFISSTARTRTLSLATSASLVLQAVHAEDTANQRAAARVAITELGRQLQSAAVAELVARQDAFAAAAGSSGAQEIPPPDALPEDFLKSAQKATAVACSSQLALIYVISSPPSGGDRLVCVNSCGAVEGQPCGKGVIGSVYRSNAPLVIHSASDDRRFITSIDTPTGIQVDNMIGVPLPCAANASISGGVLALFNVAPDMMQAAIGLQTAHDTASAIADAFTFLISGAASACVRHRMQGSISSLFSCLQRTRNLHANMELSDDVLRNGCSSFEKMIQCDAINVYTMRPGLDVMFPFQLPQHGHAAAPSRVHFPIEGLVGLAARSGCIIASTSPLDDPNYSPDIDRCGLGRVPGSVLCIPIKANPEHLQALQALAGARGKSFTFGDLACSTADKPDSRMQVDLWLPPSFAGTLAPPVFSGPSFNGEEQTDGLVAVIELVLHARRSNMTFKSDDVIVAALFASQLAIAVRNSRQLMQIDTVTAYCHPMLSSLMVDAPGGGKEQLHVLESLRRTALGLCRTQFAAIFLREMSVGRDELVSVEWLSSVSGLSLSNLLGSHPRLMKRFAPSLALRQQEQQRRKEEEAAALKANGLGSDSGGVPSVFDGLAAGFKYRQGVHGSNDEAEDDLDVPIRLRVPLSISNGGLVGACAARGQAVVMQRRGENAQFRSGIDDRHSIMTQNEVCAPICDSSGNVIAVLQLINHPGGLFSQEDLQAVKVFTLIASEALKEAEEAGLYRQWLTFTRGVRKILQIAAGPETGERESNIWQTCAAALGGMMQCVAYCFILCSWDDRRWTRYRSSGPIIKNAKRGGLPSQCIRCGDLQFQDAMSRKYTGEVPSTLEGQGYIDLLSDSDDELSKLEIDAPAASNLHDHQIHSEAADASIQEDQPDNSSAGASSSCGLLCVPLTDLHAGKGTQPLQSLILLPLFNSLITWSR